MEAPKLGEPPRTALVTGGASGIGRALAEALAERGVHVSVADRQLGLAQEVASGIRRGRGHAQAVELDVRDVERFRAVVKDLVSEAGRLDYLFNNAGIGVAGEVREYEQRDFDDVFDVNLRGVANGILAAYPVMIAQGFGHIVNTASMAGLFTTPYQVSYGASKHAVVSLSRSLRIEARPYGVRVSVLCPGVIRTPILEGGRYGRFLSGYDRARGAQAFERFRPMDPAVLARRTLDAVDRNRAIIIEPGSWRILWWLERLSPSLSDRLLGVMLARMARRMRE
jgi:NAD(P)-dependent dehydrogenase (short-subunit alcohol dehydrogenase family)